MTVFRKRTRIISFRVSEDEYRVLQRASMVEGSQSISDYARSLTCKSVEDRELRVLYDSEQITKLREKLEELQHQMKVLSDRVP